jgi:hypothetical protein
MSLRITEIMIHAVGLAAVALVAIALGQALLRFAQRDWDGRPVALTASNGVEIWKGAEAPLERASARGNPRRSRNIVYDIRCAKDRYLRHAAPRSTMTDRSKRGQWNGGPACTTQRVSANVRNAARAIRKRQSTSM